MLNWTRNRNEATANADALSGTHTPEPTKPVEAPAKAKLALALGGGAARGWAHIGVLRALDEAGIEVGMVATPKAITRAEAEFNAGTAE